MTSVTTVKKQVEELRQRIAPKPPVDLVVILTFGCDDEPHGKYGFRKLHIHSMYRKISPDNPFGYEAVPEKKELELLRRTWEENKHTRYGVKHEQKISFEDFCKHRECKCGKHG